MFQRGAEAGLKRPLPPLTDFSAGGPTTLDHMRPALNRDFNEAVESTEKQVPEPPVKVGRLLETTIVKESQSTTHRIHLRHDTRSFRKTTPLRSLHLEIGRRTHSFPNAALQQLRHQPV